MTHNTTQNRTRRSAAAVSAALLTVALASCGTPEETPTETSEPTATVTETAAPPAPAPEPTDGAQDVVLPTCEELVPLDVFTSQPFPDWENFAFINQTDNPTDAQPLPGELATTTAEQSITRMNCTWGVPNSGTAVGLDAVVIDEQARDTLVTELRNAPSEYETFDVGGAPGFITESEVGLGDGTVSYLFDGSVWLILSLPGSSAPDTLPFVEQAFTVAMNSVHAANP